MKFNIGQRVLVLFLFGSLVPLIGLNLFWLNSAQTSLKNDAASQQTLLTTAAANRVNQFLTDKINSVIIHSQTSSVQQFDLNYSLDELAAFVKQDSDILRVSLADSSGAEKIAIDRNGVSPLGNISQTDAFRVVTFLSGNEYISPVQFDVNRSPHLQIAVPLVTFVGAQSLTNLSTAESGVIRSVGDIKGALLVDVDLHNLWQSVLSAKLGKTGYAYLVDDKGNLVAHPDSTFFANNPNVALIPEVQRFLASNQESGSPEANRSETGVAVLSSYHTISKTHWAVIAEEPISSIYSDVTRVGNLALGILGITTLFAVALSLLLSRQITRPIRKLAAGASEFGRGHLGTSIELKRNDEFGLLASVFNGMATNLSKLVNSLRAESTKLNAVLNSITEGVVAMDSLGQIVVANVAAASLAGTEPAGLVSQSFAHVFPWTRKGEPATVDLDFAGSSKVYNGLTLASVDGITHYIDLVVVRIADDPNGIRYLATIHDETKNRELELMKVDFVSLAAHELRTPLTAIRGYFGLILGDKKSKFTPQTKEFIAQASVSADELSGLINNLLNVSRIERGALTIQLDKLDWADMVASTVKNYELIAKEKSIILRYDGPTKDVPVLADKISIKEVLNNLIANAIRYTSAGGTVTVKLVAGSEKIVTTVRDSGIGIPANALPHLFTKFFRVHGGLESGSGGTGLGLYISKSIVELHSGRIWVESVEGQGSTFGFTLPPFNETRYQAEIANRPKILKGPHA